MLFVIMFVSAGAAWSLVDRLLGVVAVGLALAPVLFVAMWLNDRSGLERLITSSWVWLSGVQTPGEVVQECDPSQQTSGWYLLILLLLLLFALAVGAAALVGIVATPLGLAVAPVVGVVALVKRSEEALTSLAMILTVGPGAVIVAGVGFRIEHAVSGWACTL